jgi:hypothetical protein
VPSVKGPLINRLKTFTQVAAVAGGRVYANRVPQSGDLPCVVVELDNRERYQTLDGLGGDGSGMNADTFLVRCYAHTSRDAEKIAEDIATNLEDIEGDTISDENTTVSRKVEAVVIVAERDEYDSQGLLSDIDVNSIEIELMIQHTPGE